MPDSRTVTVPVRTVLTGLVAGAAITVAHLLGRAADWPGVSFLGLTEQAAILLALVTCLWASRRGPEDLRRSWRLVSGGLILTVSASTISAVFGVVTGARPVSPALTDILYFGAYPFYLAAVFALPRRPQRIGLRDLLDGGAAGLLIALIVAAHVVTPIASSGGSGWNLAVNLGLAVADMALLWAVLAMLLSSRGLRTAWVGILAVGLAILVSGDLGYLSLAARGPVEASSPVFLVFLWGFLIVSWAAALVARSGPWIPATSGAEPNPWEKAGFHVLPMFIIVGVAAVVGVEALSREPRPFVVLGGLAIALMQALRQFLTLRENRHLLAGEREVVYRLRELDRMRADFMAVVSHDFANPLTVIGGMAAILRTRGERVPEKDRLDMLNAIEQEASRLADLARDVLTAVRAEHGELSYTFELVDVGMIADRCTRLVGQLSSAHEVAFERSGDTVVQADEARLQEVLLNLLDNAIKYSPDGGRVVVRVRGETALVRLEIEDEGVGLTSEEAAIVFDRMVRIRNSETRDIKGTGLGLYIVRRIVQAHGGRIRAEGRPGKGSAFTIELPREQPRDHRPGPRPQAEAESAG